MQKKMNNERKPQKPMLHTETLRLLNEQEIQIVVAGATIYSCNPVDCWVI